MVVTTLETDWVSVVGYLAAVLVASSFYMQTMLPLRVFAIASNICFIVYALFSIPILLPVLILHLFLLPLNITRLWQIKKLIDGVKAYGVTHEKLDWLIPYMTKEVYPQGAIILKKNDKADKLFFIQQGRVKLAEINRIVGPGEVIGEVGVLSPYKMRTIDAIAMDEVHVMSISESQVMALYYQNPKFGLFLLQIIIKRSIENYEALKNVTPHLS